LNELYWQPGGNPDLEPERSFGLESGVTYQFRFFGDGELSIGYYDIFINKLIKWYPGTDGIWLTENIEQVRSKGVELSARLGSLWNILTAEAGYKYGRAEKTGSEINGDPTVGNRLPYIPGSEFNGQLIFNYHRATAGIEISYSGFRYNTIANESAHFLPDVWIINLSAGYGISAWDWECTVYGRVDNLMKEEYQLIAGYPLPVQTWTFGLKFDLDENIFE
jgi:iron complex outermembrane receptor protein